MNAAVADREQDPNKLVLWIVLAGVAAMAIGFRVWQLPLQLLADDEWHALNKLLQSDVRGIFTSFGHADHSIPLTLYYYWVSGVTPLTENIMRFPMLVAGVLTPFLVPYLVRHILRKPEQAILFVLLALSPILIYFSRTARPYAITTLLAVVAILGFHQWVQRPEAWRALIVVSCTSLCAWMQPVTLSLLLVPYLYYGVQSIYSWRTTGNKGLFIRLLALGLGQLLVLCALLLPPIYYNHGDILDKAGLDSPTLESLTDTFKLMSGSEYTGYLLMCIVLIAVGLRTLWQRNRGFTAYLITCCCVAFLIVASSGAAWIHHALVTARYSLPLFILLAIGMAVGTYRVVCLITISKWWRAVLIGVLAVVVLVAGPLDRQYGSAINQFTSHMAYQFDYDWDANVYNRKQDIRSVSGFYRQLGAGLPEQLNLVIAPWLMEWHWNRWYLDQAVHQQRVTAGFLTSFCGEHFYGEYPDEASRVQLRHVVHVEKLLGPAARGYDYLVYHKDASRDGSDMGVYKRCLEKVRASFGRPDYEDDKLIAYKLDR